MRILVSNDDGVFAPGIQTLANALRSVAQVQVVAPERNRSAQSNALTLDLPLSKQVQDNGDIALINGTPADCVYIGLNALLNESPDLVITGINAGPNLGDDVIYSGTVAAAMEGRHLGYASMAVSLNGTTHFDSAAKVVLTLLKGFKTLPLISTHVLNINVPDVPYEQIKGIKVTRCGSRSAATQVITQTDPRGRELYWLGPPGEINDDSKGTDFDAVAQGYVSITPLQVDMTAYQAQESVASWLEKSGISETW